MLRKHKILIFVLAFLCIAAISYAQVAAGVMFLRKRVHHLTQQDSAGVDKVTKELTTQLNLTPDQQAKAQDIVSNTRKNIDAALEQGENELNAMLTDEQKVKLDQYRVKIRDEIKSGQIGQE
jgi:Spy/CpxP family protein refolding chaperone